MSGHGFHVHGPHDHELEHAAQHGEKDSFSGQIAVMTAILATVGALFSYMGGATQANAGLYKNNAAIKKTEASNQWNYYQAKSSKQNLAELAIALVADDKKVESSFAAGIITAEEKALLAKSEAARLDAIQVDDFSQEEFLGHKPTEDSPMIHSPNVKLAR